MGLLSRIASKLHSDTVAVSSNGTGSIGAKTVSVSNGNSGSSCTVCQELRVSADYDNLEYSNPKPKRLIVPESSQGSFTATGKTPNQLSANPKTPYSARGGVRTRADLAAADPAAAAAAWGEVEDTVEASAGSSQMLPNLLLSDAEYDEFLTQSISRTNSGANLKELVGGSGGSVAAGSRLGASVPGYNSVSNVSSAGAGQLPRTPSAAAAAAVLVDRALPDTPRSRSQVSLRVVKSDRSLPHSQSGLITGTSSSSSGSSKWGVDSVDRSLLNSSSGKSSRSGHAPLANCHWSSGGMSHLSSPGAAAAAAAAAAANSAAAAAAPGSDEDRLLAEMDACLGSLTTAVQLAKANSPPEKQLGQIASLVGNQRLAAAAAEVRASTCGGSGSRCGIVSPKVAAAGSATGSSWSGTLRPVKSAIRASLDMPDIRFGRAASASAAGSSSNGGSSLPGKAGSSGSGSGSSPSKNTLKLSASGTGKPLGESVTKPDNPEPAAALGSSLGHQQQQQQAEAAYRVIMQPQSASYVPPAAKPQVMSQEGSIKSPLEHAVSLDSAALAAAQTQRQQEKLDKLTNAYGSSSSRPNSSRPSSNSNSSLPGSPRSPPQQQQQQQPDKMRKLSWSGNRLQQLVRSSSSDSSSSGSSGSDGCVAKSMGSPPSRLNSRSNINAAAAVPVSILAPQPPSSARPDNGEPAVVVAAARRTVGGSGH